MKAEIITIGDELLIGQTIDTNSAWIGSELSMAGFDVMKKTSIHDISSDILNALAESEGRSDVVIITGGLGPTSDDITKPALCDFFGTRLVTNMEVLAMITGMMQRRNFPMNLNNKRQAEVPESCRVLLNNVGTAPGMWFERSGTVFISLPGVPSEMKFLMSTHILPELKQRFRSQAIVHRNLMTYGAPEALLAEKLEGFEADIPAGIKLAYLPSSGIIKLRLTGTGRDASSVAELVETQVNLLYLIIPDLIYGEEGETLEMAVGTLLRERGKTLGTAESCTGGNIARLITSVPGSSDYFTGSIVSYANSIKTELLGVDDKLIANYGAVSEPVVKAMAEGARKLLSADYIIATSGIAGPDGGTESKPVGTLWTAVSSASGTISEMHTFGADRLTNINRFSNVALNMLRLQIISA